MNEDGLRPCPFCGDCEPLYSNYGPDGHIIACTVCKVSTNFWDDQETAFANWNRRTVFTDKA